MKTEKEIIEDFETRLNKIVGKTRLDRLKTYYSTWSLPSHPNDEELYNILLHLSEIYQIIPKTINQALDNKLDIRNLFSLERLKHIFELKSFQTPSDLTIRSHIIKHFYILREIRNEIISQLDS